MISSSHKHMDSAFRLASTSRPLSRYQALTPATTKLPVRKEASPIWLKRYQNDGLKMASLHDTTWNTPSRSSVPAGVCIQLLADRIQKEEIKVPVATIMAENRCTPGGTLSRPNNRTPRNAASRKNAVMTS